MASITEHRVRSMPPKPSLPRSTLVALALVSAATLLFEVTLTRLLSVALWYPFAFLALSVAMLGLGAAAVGVSLSHRQRGPEAVASLQRWAVLMAVAVGAGYPLWNALPLRPMSLAQDPWQLVWLALEVLILAAPFAAAGAFVARAFATWPDEAPTLYGADLGGAALGVLFYVMALPHLGGPGTLMLSAAVPLVAALFAAPTTLRSRTMLALVTVAVLAAAPGIEAALPLRITPNKLLGTPIARHTPRDLHWSLSSAVDVVPAHGGALIVIDGGTAMTLAPHAERIPMHRRPPPPSGLRALPFVLGPGHSTLIIGSGGGLEVRAALGADSRRIVAIEVDRAITALVRGPLSAYIGGIFGYPAVHLVTAEARSYLAAQQPPQHFDAIMAFHTISNAASSTGALALTENYLLTVQALRLLVGRLSHDGIFVMTRPEQQMGRLVRTLAVAEPRPDLAHHVAVVTSTRRRPSFLTALVYSAQPMGRIELAALHRTVPGRIVYAPDGTGDMQAYYAAVLAGTPPPEPPYRAATLQPTTDDRPFFNLTRRWSSLRWGQLVAVLGAGERARAHLEDLPMAQLALLAALVLLVAAASGLLLPTARRLRRRGVAHADTLPVAAVCAGLGFAYMTVEVSLVETLTRLMGEPSLSLVAVLAVLLMASGGGSLLFAGRARWSPARGAFAAMLAAALAAWCAPFVANAAAGLALGWRIGVVVFLVTPVGLALGIPFAATLRRLQRNDLVAWAWATNSVLAVGGSIGALIIASAVGLRTTGLIAAGVYGLVGLVATRLPAATSA